MFYSRFLMLFSPDLEDGGSAPVLDPTPDPTPDPPPETPPESIYGELKVNWQGVDEALHNESSLKPFVDEKGEIRIPELMKSYYDTKKSFGKEKITLPTDKSTKEEIDEFYQKVNGYDPVVENYKLKENEESNLEDGFVEKLRQFGHQNRLPVSAVESLRELLESQVNSDDTATVEEEAQLRETHLNELKKEWGESYEPRIIGAKNLINEYLDDDLKEAFKDPAIGNNPVLIKVLGSIASKLYKEGTFPEGNAKGTKTPQEVEDSINEILGDSKHPYNDHDHPSHKKASGEMLKLFELRNKYRK